jgi:hypothetical protein
MLKRVLSIAIALGVFLGVTTRVLVGMAAKQTASGSIQQPGQAHLGGRLVRIKPGMQKQPGISAKTGNHWMKYTNLSVAVTEHDVDVSAKVQVGDLLGNLRYVWLLRVYKPAKPNVLLWEHHYLEQIFTLPHGETTMNPSFHDKVPLPVGDYRVEVTLYSVPPDFQFDKVKFGEDMKPIVTGKLGQSRPVGIN